MDSLEDWLSELKASDKQIVVEGIKDIRSLKSLGIPEERISDIKGPLFSFIENVAETHKQIILLTDIDVEGDKLFKTLYTDFPKLGVVVDRSFRDWLINNTPVSHIEGLSSYTKKFL